MSICTKEASSRHPSENYQFDQIKALTNVNGQEAAQEVLYFIIERLSQVGAPVGLMYGTLLHEFRNGTGPCVIPRADDKDFDVAVFPEHFHLIVNMTEEIDSLFGFTVKKLEKNRLYIALAPRQKTGIGFQIDVYGFRCDDENGLIHFPWDVVSVQMTHFLPLVKHKTLPTTDTNSTNGISEPLYHYMPFKPRCLLANMYGVDFMTPKNGHFIQRDAFTHSEYAGCEKEMTAFEKEEFVRQQSFCQPERMNVLTNTRRIKLLENEAGSRQDEMQSKNDSYPMHHDHDNFKSGIVTCIK